MYTVTLQLIARMSVHCQVILPHYYQVWRCFFLQGLIVHSNTPLGSSALLFSSLLVKTSPPAFSNAMTCL